MASVFGGISESASACQTPGLRSWPLPAGTSGDRAGAEPWNRKSSCRRDRNSGTLRTTAVATDCRALTQCQAAAHSMCYLPELSQWPVAGESVVPTLLLRKLRQEVMGLTLGHTTLTEQVFGLRYLFTIPEKLVSFALDCAFSIRIDLVKAGEQNWTFINNYYVLTTRVQFGRRIKETQTQE